MFSLRFACVSWSPSGVCPEIRRTESHSAPNGLFSEGLGDGDGDGDGDDGDDGDGGTRSARAVAGTSPAVRFAPPSFCFVYAHYSAGKNYFFNCPPGLFFKLFSDIIMRVTEQGL